ncbi:MAG TPA: MlaD family protein [Saprospiraceae bacterium]|nr:MlaD family protein [Saprospiraceae bacterium]
MKNEIKIGLLGLVTLALLVFGFKFLKGNNILDHSKTYYVTYSDVQMLEASAPVIIHGIKVGSVIKINLDKQRPDLVIVTLDVKQDYQLPTDTRAVLKSNGLIGGKLIELEFDQHCTSDCLENKATIPGTYESVLSQMLPKDELTNYIQTAGKELKYAFDSISNPHSNSQMSLMVRNLYKTLDNLAQTTQQLDRLMAINSQSISGTIKNLETISKTLSSNSGAINNTLSHLESISKDIKNSEPGKLVNNLNQTLTDTKKTIGNLDQTIQQSEKTISQLNSIVSKVNQGQGTLGKLFSDKELYDNLNKTSKNLELLLQDLRLNPQRYIHVSVFRGKGDKYTLPENDPAVPKN